jgi:hypothetical protein
MNVSNNIDLDWNHELLKIPVIITFFLCIKLNKTKKINPRVLLICKIFNTNDVIIN